MPSSIHFLLRARNVLTGRKIANKGHTTERGAFRERPILLARDYVDDANGHVTAALRFPRVTNRAHVFTTGKYQQIEMTRATPRARAWIAAAI